MEKDDETNALRRSMSVTDAIRREETKMRRQALSPSLAFVLEAAKAAEANHAFLTRSSSIAEQVADAARRYAQPAFLDPKLQFATDVVKAVVEKYRKDFAIVSLYADQFRMLADSDLARRMERLAVVEPVDVIDRVVMADMARVGAEVATALKHPWAFLDAEERSVSSMVRLHGIGRSLSTIHPFDDDLTDALRDDLGDWRDGDQSPVDGVETDAATGEELPGGADPEPANVEARVTRYVDRGLDLDLTDFPVAAFDDAMASARLMAVLDASGAIEARNDVASKMLRHLEGRIRAFIDTHMQRLHGDDWHLRQLPSDVGAAWQEKTQRASENGKPYRRPIDAADFTDYEKIIVRKDNWREVFQGVFKRREFVIECFARLYFPRVLIAHSNLELITNEDLLLFLVEARRLVQAFGIARS